MSVGFVCNCLLAVLCGWAVGAGEWGTAAFVALGSVLHAIDGVRP